MIAFVFVLLLAMMLMTTPIYVALAGTVTVVFALFSDIPLMIVIQRMFAGINKFSLMSIPFFILAANVMSYGGISKRIIKLANILVGELPGGLAMTVVLASMFFGAISGSAPATVISVGALLYPALLEKKYGEHFSAGIVTASGSLGIIIPPSVTMIVYGAITGASVGALFMSGFGAGVVFSLGFILYAFLYGKKHKAVITTQTYTIKEKIKALKDAAWGMGIPIIILGGIYSGIFTPTEASAVAVFYALFVALIIYREMTVKSITQMFVRSSVTTAQVMILLSAASIFAWLLTSEGATTLLASSMLQFSSHPLVILMMMNVIFLVGGMFIDGASLIMILVPLIYPIATRVGIDPIHLGIVITVNCAIGMFTPPFGLNLFVASGITNKPLSFISKSVLPFIAISMVILIIITLFPSLSLWLPNAIYK